MGRVDGRTPSREASQMRPCVRAIQALTGPVYSYRRILPVIILANHRGYYATWWIARLESR